MGCSSTDRGSDRETEYLDNHHWSDTSLRMYINKWRKKARSSNSLRKMHEPPYPTLQKKEKIESTGVRFRAGLEQSSHKFACRYDVLNITGNGNEFFNVLTKVIGSFLLHLKGIIFF